MGEIEAVELFATVPGPWRAVTRATREIAYRKAVGSGAHLSHWISAAGVVAIARAR